MSKNKSKKNKKETFLKLNEDEKEEKGSILKNLVDSYMNKEKSFSLREQISEMNRSCNELPELHEEEMNLDGENANEETNENEGVNTEDQNGSDTVVFLGNVPLSIQTKSDLIKKLNLDPRIVQSVHFRSLPIDPKYASNKKVGVIKKKFSNAKDSQNAYVKLTDDKYLDQILEKNTMEVDGHHIFVNANNSDTFSKFSRKKTVFVGRLNPSTTEDELYNVFMNISPVKAVRIVRDPVTMKSKGFGFVAFDSRTAVSEAILEFNNKEFKGYTLNVTKCLDEVKLQQSKKEYGKNRKKKAVKKFNKRKTHKF